MLSGTMRRCRLHHHIHSHTHYVRPRHTQLTRSHTAAICAASSSSSASISTTAAFSSSASASASSSSAASFRPTPPVRSTDETRIFHLDSQASKRAATHNHILRTLAVESVTLARQYFDFSIPRPDAHHYSILFDAYIEAGELTQAREFYQLRRDRAASQEAPPLDSVFLASHAKLLLRDALSHPLGSHARWSIIDEVEALWSEMKLQPSQLISGYTTNALMKFYQRADENNIRRQIEIMEEALKLEGQHTVHAMNAVSMIELRMQPISEQRALDIITHIDSNKPPSSSASTAAISSSSATAASTPTPLPVPPLYVTNACVDLLLQSFNRTHVLTSCELLPIVVELWRLIHTRLKYARQVRDAQAGIATRDYLHDLQVVPSTFGLFIRFFVRTHHMKLVLYLWSRASNQQKLDNPSIYTVLLTYYSKNMTSENSHQIDALMDEYQKFELELDLKLIASWIACYIPTGNVVQADCIWNRMIDAKLTPDASVTIRMLQVYLQAYNHDPSQLTRIDTFLDPCHSMLTRVITPILKELSRRTQSYKLTHVLDYFESIPSSHRDMTQFGTLIQACLERHQWKRAADVLEVLRHQTKGDVGHESFHQLVKQLQEILTRNMQSEPQKHYHSLVGRHHLTIEEEYDLTQMQADRTVLTSLIEGYYYTAINSALLTPDTARRFLQCLSFVGSHGTMFQMSEEIIRYERLHQLGLKTIDPMPSEKILLFEDLRTIPPLYFDTQCLEAILQTLENPANASLDLIQTHRRSFEHILLSFKRRHDTAMKRCNRASNRRLLDLGEQTYTHEELPILEAQEQNLHITPQMIARINTIMQGDWSHLVSTRERIAMAPVPLPALNRVAHATQPTSSSSSTSDSRNISPPLTSPSGEELDVELVLGALEIKEFDQIVRVVSERLSRWQDTNGATQSIFVPPSITPAPTSTSTAPTGMSSRSSSSSPIASTSMTTLQRFTSRLTALSVSGDWQEAHKLVAQFNETHTGFWSPELFTLYLKCFVRRSNVFATVQAAEKVWSTKEDKFLGRDHMPSITAYSTMLQIYYGSPNLANSPKITAILAEMTTRRQNGWKLQFSKKDINFFIGLAKKHNLPDEIRRWEEIEKQKR